MSDDIMESINLFKQTLIADSTYGKPRSPTYVMNPYDFLTMMGVKFKPDRKKRVTKKRWRKAMAEAHRRHNDP